MTGLSQRLAVLVEELRGKRAAADARHVRLGDAKDAVDTRGPHARARHGATCRAVARGDEGVGAVVNVELRGLRAFEEHRLAST